MKFWVSYTWNNVSFDVKNVSVKGVHHGSVADSKNDLPMEAAGFPIQVLTLNHPHQISAGCKPVLHDQVSHIAWKFAKVKEKTDSYSGKKLEDGLKFLKSDHAALVDMVLWKLLCRELLYHPLDQLAVHGMKQIITVVVIKSVDTRLQELVRLPSLPIKLSRINEYYP